MEPVRSGPAASEPATLPVQQEETPEPPVRVPSPREAIAPAVQGVRDRTASARSHTPAAQAASSAQDAAIDPSTEQRRGAATQTVANIDAAAEDPGSIDRSDFKTKLKEALQRAVPTPRSPEDAERLREHGAGQTSLALSGEIHGRTQAVAGPLASASDSSAEVRAEDQPALPGQELVPEQTGPPPAPVSPASVVPAPFPSERLDYSSDRQETDMLMAENSVSREQLQRGNDPDFNSTLQARAAAVTNETSAPARYREMESGVRDETHETADQALQGGLGALHASRSSGISSVVNQQLTTQGANSAERARITAEIDRFKNATRSDVEAILVDMESGAADKFEAGLQRAEAAYEEVFEEEKGGFLAGVGDFFTGGGDERLERAFRTARAAYDREVSRTIDEVADFVERKLAEAKSRVGEGRRQIDTFVDSLDTSVRRFGEEARSAIIGDFDKMVADIDQRSDSLVDALAQRYAESQRRLEALEERLREENKGFWARVYDATVGVVKKIIEFKNLLLGILARAAAVVGAIIDDPIGFLGNLISGVKAGLDAFVENIGQHLKDGFMAWLFGAMQGAGIQLPERFDLKGIFSLIFQVLGLTYANIRQRAVLIVGETVVTRLEQAAEIFRILRTEGLAGLWQMLVDKVVVLKDTVMEEIQSWLITRVVKAGITWLLGLLNPAGAFIKACMAIYEIVKFFIERGRQIIDLVNAVIDSLSAIVGGNLQAMARAVEGALARAIPVAIGFLASLLGLGGISEEVREIIERIQAPINTAIDWVINKAVETVRAIGGLFGGGRQEELAGGQEVEGEYDGQLGKNITWSAAGESHQLWIAQEGANAVVMMSSSPKPVSQQLREYAEEAQPLDGELRDEIVGLVSQAMTVLEQVDSKADDLNAQVRSPATTPSVIEEKDNEVETTEDHLKSLLARIQDKLGHKPAVEEAHREAADSILNPNMLLGRGPSIAGHRGRRFRAATHRAVNALGDARGCHTLGVTAPGTRSGNWIPDHQPPEAVLKGGGGPSVRFYPHSLAASHQQRYEVIRYKAKMKRLLGRQESGWAEGVMSSWFWA